MSNETKSISVQVMQFLEWDREVDILVIVFPLPHFGREECC